MWLILSKYRVQIVSFVVLLCVGWTMGFGMAKSVYQREVNVLKLKHAQQNAEREQQHAHKLQIALSEQQKWQAFAQQQGLQLAQAQQQLDIQAAQLHKDNHHAIQQDNSGSQPFNGIGTHSLRQYNRAFGYD